MNKVLDPKKETPEAAAETGRRALFAGGVAAIRASTCCLGPLVLVLLGFSGAWISNLTVLEPYRFQDRTVQGAGETEGPLAALATLSRTRRHDA